MSLTVESLYGAFVLQEVLDGGGHGAFAGEATLTVELFGGLCATHEFHRNRQPQSTREHILADRVTSTGDKGVPFP